MQDFKLNEVMLNECFVSCVILIARSKLMENLSKSAGFAIVL
jgi:hypothetical protein